MDRCSDRPSGWAASPTIPSPWRSRRAGGADIWVFVSMEWRRCRGWPCSAAACCTIRCGPIGRCDHGCVNSRQEAWQALKFASPPTPLKDYAAWHARFARPLELDGLDRPCADWARTAALRLLLRVDDDAGPEDVRATIASLQAQIYPRWSARCRRAGGDSRRHHSGLSRLRGPRATPWRDCSAAGVGRARRNIRTPMIESGCSAREMPCPTMRSR